MFALPWGLLLRVGAVIAVAVALMYAWHVFTDHYREQGRIEVRAEWEADKARRIALTTAMTNAWDQKRQEAERAASERDQARAARAFAVQRAARTLPPAVAGTRVAPAFVGVLRASRDFANAAGPAAVPDEAAAPAAAGADAESSLGLVAEWVAEVAEIHAECRDQVQGWITYYAALQAAQPKGASP